MTWNFLRQMIVFSIFLALPYRLMAQNDHKPVLVLLDFKAGNGVTEAEISTITTYIASEIIASDLFRVMERRNIPEILEEQSFQSSGLTETRNAARIGQMLSANKIMIGEVYILYNRCVLTSRIVDVETGRAELSGNERCDEVEELPAAAASLAKKMIRTYRSRFDLNEDGTLTERNRWSYIWRAMVFPGLGHYYGGNNLRGSIYTGLFFASIANYVSKSNEVRLDPQNQEKRVRRDDAAALIVFAYGINILDAGLFAGKDEWFVSVSADDSPGTGSFVESSPSRFSLGYRIYF